MSEAIETTGAAPNPADAIPTSTGDIPTSSPADTHKPTPADEDAARYTMTEIEEAGYRAGIRYASFKSLQVELFAARAAAAKEKT